MLYYGLQLQPEDGRYAGLVGQALRDFGDGELLAAVAYATTNGVAAIWRILAGHDRLSMRWLVGVDWCRTDPHAPPMMAQWPNCAVRVPDGRALVERNGCAPRRSFHPKSWGFYVDSGCALIVGSGNLSRTGLTQGWEHGTMIGVKGGMGSPAEEAIVESIHRYRHWFESQWEQATPYEEIYDDYVRRCQESPRPPVDDESITEPEPGGVPLNRLQLLRRAQVLWVETGELYKNLTTRGLGNQLDLSPMTRVFFGFEPRVLPRNSRIGPVAMLYGGSLFVPNMRFGDNSMDKLNLPVPGRRGAPDTYDYAVLRWTRGWHPPYGEVFVLEMLDEAQAAAAREASERAGTLFEMSGGRRWGIY